MAMKSSGQYGCPLT